MYLLRSVVYIQRSATDLSGLPHSAWNSSSLLLAETMPQLYLYPELCPNTAATSPRAGCLHVKLSHWRDWTSCCLQNQLSGYSQGNRLNVVGSPARQWFYSYSLIPVSTHLWPGGLSPVSHEFWYCQHRIELMYVWKNKLEKNTHTHLTVPSCFYLSIKNLFWSVLPGKSPFQVLGSGRKQSLP